MTAFINNIKIGEVISVSITTEVDVFQDPEDCKSFIKGSRTYKGSITLKHYNIHSLMDEVFKLSSKVNYSDQLPPFDLTIMGIEQGKAIRMVIFSVEITKETGSFNSNKDNETSFEFNAKAISPWRAIDGLKTSV